MPIVDDPPRIALTRARLAADLGDRAEAIELFAQLGAKSNLPMDLRCEAVVRQAALLVQEGRPRDGYALYRFVDSHCADQPEAMRLLVEAVTGVQQDPETWRGRTEKFVLEFVSTSDLEPAQPRIEYLADIPEQRIDSLPSDGEEWQPTTFTGEPISITMKDGDFVDIMRLFSTMSGMRIDLAPEALPFAKPVSLELRDVPWDQALSLVLQTNRLRAVKVDGGFRIEPLPAGAPEPIDPLMRSVQLCLDAYKRDNGHYPIVAGTAPIDNVATLLEPSYIRTLPRHAADGTPYIYSCSDGIHYELRAEAAH